MSGTRTLLDRAKRAISTTRCRACGERYRRLQATCPACRTKKGGSRHVPHDYARTIGGPGMGIGGVGGFGGGAGGAGGACGGAGGGGGGGCG